MANNTAIYAIASNDLGETRKHAEDVLGVTFKGVDSDSWGLYYTTPGQGENKISVFQNFNPSDRRWVAPDHYEKVINGIAVLVEEVRTRRKTLNFKTMWIQKQT